jgi:hypothetical protein
MREAERFCSRPLPNGDTIIEGEDKRREEIVMGAIRRAERERWRRTKSIRKLERPAKDSGPKTVERGDCVRGEQPDRLLVSALNYWEVKRDRIEERLAAIRSATAASEGLIWRGH